MIESIQEYYLALLQLQMAVLGFVIAGVVALLQMLTNAKPQRDIRLLVRYRVLIAYIVSLGLLLLAIALGCWVVTFPSEATRMLGAEAVPFFAQGSIPLIFLILCIGDLFILAYLTFKARDVLDSRKYLIKYTASIKPHKMRKYLATIYSGPTISPASVRRTASARSPHQYIHDPFQPIREYIKDNAFKSYDYGTATGLRLFGSAFDRTLSAAAKKPAENEYYYLARYISESALEFFSIFQKTTSEKRKMDVLRMVYEKGEMLLRTSDDEGLLTIVRGLENIANIAEDEDEIIAAVGYIHALTDAYLAAHKRAKWSTVARTFEETCLSVTRLSENYYLQRENPLKTVPIIGYYTGEHRTVTAALVDFFTSYNDLADRYPDAYPQHYFEAIEAVVEVLFARLGEITASGGRERGLNVMYHRLAESLYSLYRSFGVDAIEHKKPELLALCMGNIRRVLKPAKNFELDDERKILTSYLIELAFLGIEAFGDMPLKGERTISAYTVETLRKHAQSDDIRNILNDKNYSQASFAGELKKI